jgi:hypothetical protein
MAELSGLSVSALRFYDCVGILLPASVDPVNRRHTAGEYGRSILMPVRLDAVS